MSRTTWSMAEEAAQHLEDVADRRDEESATEFVERVAELLEDRDHEHEHESDQGQEQEPTTRYEPDGLLTEDHINDIAARTARETADELESRLR